MKPPQNSVLCTAWRQRKVLPVARPNLKPLKCSERCYSSQVSGILQLAWISTLHRAIHALPLRARQPFSCSSHFPLLKLPEEEDAALGHGCGRPSVLHHAGIIPGLTQGFLSCCSIHHLSGLRCRSANHAAATRGSRTSLSRGPVGHTSLSWRAVLERQARA